MSAIEFYTRLGFTHIVDLQGYDHMLFLLALVSGYGWADRRKILWLVTAFTVGHSLTLLLTATDALRMDGAVIEFLIAFTILCTAVGNLLLPPDAHPKSWWLRYALALGFGLVHGMGFSNGFRSLLGTSGEALLAPLLWFNCGIELGQLLVVAGLMGVGYVVVDVLKLQAKWWRIGISMLAGGWAILLMWQRLA